VRVEDGDDDEVDAVVGVALVKKVRTDPEVLVVGRVVGKPDDDSARGRTSKDQRDRTKDLLCIPFATPIKMPAMAPKTEYSFVFLVSSLLKNFLFSGSSGSVDRLRSLND